MNKVVSLKISNGKGRSRMGDTSAPPSRSNRFVRTEGSWYYRTRENKNIGPYVDRSEAEKSAKSFAGVATSLNEDSLGDLIGSHIETLASKHESSLSRTVPLRAGEWEAPRYRAARVYQQDGQWYFRTREGAAVGPYISHQDVETSSKLFTDFAKKIKLDFVEGLVVTMNSSRTSFPEDEDNA